jgi:hypothetical protein
MAGLYHIDNCPVPLLGIAHRLVTAACVVVGSASIEAHSFKQVATMMGNSKEHGRNLPFLQFGVINLSEFWMGFHPLGAKMEGRFYRLASSQDVIFLFHGGTPN